MPPGEIISKFWNEDLFCSGSYSPNIGVLLSHMLLAFPALSFFFFAAISPPLLKNFQFVVLLSFHSDASQLILQINHFYFKTFYFRSMLYILLPSHLPFHFHFHNCLDLFPFTKVFSQVDAVYLLLHSHLPPSAPPLLPRHFAQGHRQGTR